MEPEQHKEMIGGMNETIASIREMLQNGDIEGALSSLDQLEQQMGEEEGAEEEGIAPGQSAPAGGGMPDSVQRFAGMKQ